MNIFVDAFAWLFSPERLEGTYALPVLFGQHLFYTAVAMLIAGVIAVPIGWWIGHTGKGREVAVTISGAARAIPSFGLMVLLTLILGAVRVQEAAIIAFILLAIPSLLAGAYTGFEAIERRVIDAARAMGMTGWQVFWKVEVPLGLPLLVGGIRTALLQVIATVTIAAYIGNLGGLGWPIIQGLALRHLDEVLGGSILVAVLARVVDLLMAGLQRAVVPAGVRVQEPGARKAVAAAS